MTNNFGGDYENKRKQDRDKAQEGPKLRSLNTLDQLSSDEVVVQVVGQLKRGCVNHHVRLADL